MSLFIPDFIFEKVPDITLDFLVKNDVKGLLLDIDNTLALSNDNNPFEGTKDWIYNMINNNIKLILISNNNERRVKAFAEIFNLEYFFHSKKPLKKNILLACNKLGLKSDNIAIVGDQIFSDILGGNRCGIKSFLILSKEIESNVGALLLIKRKLEKIFIRKYEKRLKR